MDLAQDDISERRRDKGPLRFSLFKDIQKQQSLRDSLESGTFFSRRLTTKNGLQKKSPSIRPISDQDLS